MMSAAAAPSKTSGTPNATTPTQTNEYPVDMSTRLGGRVFSPALPVVDGAPPTPLEVAFTATLLAYSHHHIPLEAIEGIQRRERVLNCMGALCRDWIQAVAVRKGLPLDVASSAGGQLFTSGSYRLGVHEPGADIDTILVAPSVCHRADFFGTLSNTTDEDDLNAHRPQRDPHSLAARIQAHPDVTNFVPVEGAAVPLLTFDWEGVNIDLLFARLNSNSVPPDFDVDNDVVLDGADSATEKSLNGPRVTNLIAAFVSGTPTRYQTFLTVVRCVRKWAKQRGLYSNKMGYWGGVNINIGVALTLQLYPNASPAAVLRKFFLLFKTWRWPQPLMLTKPHDAGYGLHVWSPSSSSRHASSVAPMITPAYPAMNSTVSVSRQTLIILQEEFHRAYEIVEQLWKDYQASPNDAEPKIDWNRLFEPSDFFISYPRYLSLCIVGPTQAEAQAWAGFVESRLRKLVSDLLAKSLPLKKIQLWPKKLEACVADKSALLTQAQRQNCITYFIGFHIDTHRMRGDQLNVEIALQNFRDWDLSRFQPLIVGCDILIKHFKVKELPKMCFDEMYDGGKVAAMHKRRLVRDTDPVRLERKKMARLDELKAKMAEMQRKKEEQHDKKKRKREVDTEEELVTQEDVEPDQIASATAVTTTNATTATTMESDETDFGDAKETFMLVDALDTIEQNVVVDDEKATADEQLDEVDPNEEGYESENDDGVGYSKDDLRQVTLQRSNKNDDDQRYHDKRSLPVSDEVMEQLRSYGYNIVSDDEAVILGANLLPPWRSKQTTARPTPAHGLLPPIRFKITVQETDDLVELDPFGHVIDKGDEDFTPSKSWIGRKAGFEFKLGERGLGYYRTGKKVVVPSNTAY